MVGNGMLLSRHIRLVAAFDPPARLPRPSTRMRRSSFTERGHCSGCRAPSWADYDATPDFEGGGVHARTAKSIAITPRVRQVLGMLPMR